MQFSLVVHGDDEHVCHVDATSAEDAIRQLSGDSSGTPFRARFLTIDEAREHEPVRAVEFLATRRRSASQDAGHTRTPVARDARR
ncbi:MAG TPA: hypothetical protein VGH76_05870 [Actinomycetospora sp.]|jgi:hypothetical protein|uniref:hypothetical protein n=1 Tax=Actinomycetospora sp. TaxID=1872135 RepID=UPI002F3FA909